MYTTSSELHLCSNTPILSVELWMFFVPLLCKVYNTKNIHSSTERISAFEHECLFSKVDICVADEAKVNLLVSLVPVSVRSKKIGTIFTRQKSSMKLMH